ncbi:MAG TPA: SGNH/GDSL hydrolase family protein [Rudaea sp.]|nr:SGNH/GDSL hydrolase family protein [Rudaea sp.]
MILGIGVASAHAADARFLALGDSYTIGEGVDADGRWPDQLAAALRKSGSAVAAPEIVARTGWTTDELSGAMDKHAFDPPYDLVALLIGVNNQYRGRDIDNYRTEFRALLQRAITLAGDRPQHVVVVSIPDWGVTRFGQHSGRDTRQIARELDLYNAANAEIAASLRVRYADVTPVSRDGGGQADMLVGDGLHPSAAMYARWLATIEPQARAALASP